MKAHIHLYAWYFIIYFHSRYPTDENNIFEPIKYFCVTKVRCGHMSSQFAPGCEDQWQQSQQIRSQHHNSWPHHSPGVAWHCVTPPRDNQPRDTEQSSKKCWWSPQINWLELGVTRVTASHGRDLARDGQLEWGSSPGPGAMARMETLLVTTILMISASASGSRRCNIKSS